MRITYTGRKVELAPAQLQKLEAQFAKVGKLLDGKKSECEARIVLSHERHLQKAEVTVKYHDHSLVSLGEDTDLFAAIHGAAVKLEKQTLKVRAKWRDGKRLPRKESSVEAQPVVPAPEVKNKLTAKSSSKANGVPAVKPAAVNGRIPKLAKPQINRIADVNGGKPMTVQEAILVMDDQDDCFTFRDSKTGNLSILVRRRDGHFDLVEA